LVWLIIWMKGLYSRPFLLLAIEKTKER